MPTRVDSRGRHTVRTPLCTPLIKSSQLARAEILCRNVFNLRSMVNSVIISTQTAHYRWEDYTARERTGHPLSYADVWKNELSNTRLSWLPPSWLKGLLLFLHEQKDKGYRERYRRSLHQERYEVMDATIDIQSDTRKVTSSNGPTYT